MALTTCKDCGTEISRAALACPKCGRKFNRTSPATWGCGALLLLVIIGMFTNTNIDRPTSAHSSASGAPPSARNDLTSASSTPIVETPDDAFLKTKAGKLWKKHNGEWSTTDCKMIVDGKIHIGMTRDQVRAAWGRPTVINESLYSSGTHEQWVYRRTDDYVYFENGVMTSLQQTH